jgi:Domain of unknown function (DUF5664)
MGYSVPRFKVGDIVTNVNIGGKYKVVSAPRYPIGYGDLDAPIYDFEKLDEPSFRFTSSENLYIKIQEAIKESNPVENPVANAEGGIKFDNKKVRPGLMFRSMPEATMSIINVLEYGARKYAPDNWSKVEDDRYEEAMLRHIMAYFSGEKLDDETKEPHLAHAICCAMFLIQKEINRNK